MIGIVGLLGTACSGTWSGSEVTLKDQPAGETTASLPAETGKKVPVAVKQAKDVLVTERDITDRKYRVLGDIDVTVNKTTIFHPDPTRELVNQKLQEEAAAIGADAVILVRYGTVGVSFFSWGSLDGKGRAVAFEK